MSTPTPRTDAATHPADCLGQTLVTNRDCPCALERELTALTAERNQLRAVFPQICAALGNGAFCTPTVSVGFIESIPNEVELVIAELRARAERAEADAAAYFKRAESFSKLADEAEAELAAERARLDWLESPAGVDWQWSSSALTIRRAVIDAAMKEDAK